MGQTVVEKVADRHRTDASRTPAAAGDYLTLRPHRVLSHDNSAAVMAKFGNIGATRVADPDRLVIALDHDVQNRSPVALERYRSIELFARQHGIEFHPAGSGIGHQLMVEQLHVLPGAFVVAADSHANMYGALGAVGTPVTRSDAAAIWATGELWWEVPPTVRVTLHGKLPSGATGKDAILALCGRHSGGEVLGRAVEFGGPGVVALDIDSRLTIANMTTEWGAVSGWFPADRVALDFLRQRRRALGKTGERRLGDDDLRAWSETPLEPDDDAGYAGELTLDLASVTPHVTGPDAVQRSTPLAEIEARRIAIQKAYLVSCVNGRAGDIQAAARVLRGRRVADGVQFYIAAASRQAQAASGDAWQTLLDAGARPLPAGCGPCIGLGAGLLEAGEVGISATNRNFKGRMGSPEASCYLASPAVVAASAAAGFICGPEAVGGRPAGTHDVVSSFTPSVAEPAGGSGRPSSAEPSKVRSLVAGFPRRIRGPLVFLPQDHLDTDGIYAKEHLYRDLTPKAMARFVFENYDPALTGRLERGDVIVAGSGFGAGSSREQAVTALMARGVGMVVAASFSQTYLRNAFNNGFVCAICPELVAWLRTLFADPVSRGEKTIRPGDDIDVDFSSEALGFRDRNFRFPAPGSVLQGLVAAGGIENQVRRQLGLPPLVSKDTE